MTAIRPLWKKRKSTGCTRMCWDRCWRIPGKRKLFLALIAAVFLVTMSFPLFQWVKFRMLPKANKNTFLVSIDMPSGTVMENTDRVARAVGDYLQQVPEVKDYETFVGTGSVMDFNGLLRGGAFRDASHFADIRVNLVDKEERKISSEKLVLKIRPDIERWHRSTERTSSWWKTRRARRSGQQSWPRSTDPTTTNSAK